MTGSLAVQQSIVISPIVLKKCKKKKNKTKKQSASPKA